MRKALVGLGTVGVVMISIYFMQSQKTDIHKAKASEEISRDIAELKADAAQTKGEKKKYQARATEASGKITAIEAEEAAHKVKVKKFGADLDGALNDMEKEDRAKDKPK